MPVVHKTFSVANMRLQTSADSIERRISALNGIFHISVSITDGTMQIDYDPDVISEKQILSAVRDCGYIAYTQEIPIITEAAEEKDEVPRQILVPLGACGFLLIFWIMHAPVWIGWVPLAVVFFTAGDVFHHALDTLKSHNNDSSLLAAAGSILAAIIGIAAVFCGRSSCPFFFHAGTILTAAKAELLLLESNRRKLNKPLQELRKQLPASSSIYEDHTEHQTKLDDIRKDQIIVIRPGETVPADGRVTFGFAVMNESALTGTDLPVEKSEGSYVYASSRCISGSIEIKAERIGTDTAMMHFAQLAEKTASDNTFRSPFRSFERYIEIYILFCAVITFAGWMFIRKDFFFAASVFLAVLCCSSMESMAIAAGNAVMHAAQEAASRHVLFRNIHALELVGKTDAVVMEQDGTVTDGDYVVTDFIPAEDVSSGRLEYIAYALESRNNKPFAKAITHYLRGRRISNINVAEFAKLGAHGRRAVSTMSRFSAGTIDEIEAKGISAEAWTDRVNALYADGKRVLLFTEDDRIIGVIAAIKPMIPDCEKAVDALKENDVSITLITSGTWESSELLKERLHLENVVYSPSTLEKDQLLHQLHDSEATAAYITSGYVSSLQDADITVAISAGTEIDQNNADILLTRNRLEDFVYAMQLSSVLNEQIQQLQMYLIIYHVLAGILFGFVLPMTLQIAVPPILACVCSLAVVDLILRFSSVNHQEESPQETPPADETEENGK